LEKPIIAEIFEKVKKDGRRELLEIEAKRVLSACGIPTNRTELATSADEAVRIARELHYPVVLKITSPDILHKSDAQGVKIGIGSETELRRAFDEIVSNARAYLPKARIIGVTVQEHLAHARETIVGGFQDKSFGSTLMFGLGGVWVEILKDVSFRLAPLQREDALEMIREIKGYPLLSGYRGAPEADIDALAETLVKIGNLISEFPQISELDVNPLFVFDKGKGVKAVDARMVLGDGS
jgi:acyl-CoA synthetase (NDP forming)